MNDSTKSYAQRREERLTEGMRQAREGSRIAVDSEEKRNWREQLWITRAGGQPNCSGEEGLWPTLTKEEC